MLDLWLAFPVILAELDADGAVEIHRDLYLDRSRTLYELEAAADLGDSMTAQTSARLALMIDHHRARVLLATLDALRGGYNAPSLAGDGGPSS